MGLVGGIGRSVLLRLWLPYPPYLLKLVFRAGVLWVLLRTALLLLGEGSLSFGASVLAVGGVALLAVVEARRAREPLFHELLGASPAWSGLIPVLMALGCEALMRLLLHLL